MAGLQRSNKTFRRSGSSGVLVWNNRFLCTEEKQQQQPKKTEDGHESTELIKSRSVGYTGMLERSRSNGGGKHRYRTGRMSPTMDPPSPKISGCGFCGVFGKEETAKKGRRASKR